MGRQAGTTNRTELKNKRRYEASSVSVFVIGRIFECTHRKARFEREKDDVKNLEKKPHTRVPRSFLLLESIAEEKVL